jgi:hypothetical protein
MGAFVLTELESEVADVAVSLWSISERREPCLAAHGPSVRTP